MKRKVIITLEVDPKDYCVKNNEFEIVALVEAMINNEADFPNQIEITCGQVTRLI